jgi:2-hydroxychromene-2-carboxylate isomerase
MTNELSLDVYWSFNSPWSYLATSRLVEMQKQYQLQVNFNQVYPIAISDRSVVVHTPPAP